MLHKGELEKLNPQERIKKLNRLLEKKKREFAEIEELIKKSMEEAKTDRIAVEVAPEPREVDISHLFEPSGSGLERAVQKKDGQLEDTGQAGYIAISQQYSDYSSLKKILPYAVSGNLNDEQLQAVDKIGERLEKFKYKSATKEAEEIITASRATLSKIRKYAGLD